MTRMDVRRKMHDVTATTSTTESAEHMLEITFEFVGGPNDGEVLHGTLGEPSDAERYYLFSNHGTVGQPFSVASQYAIERLASEQLKEEKRHYFQRHYYVVTKRLEDGEKVRVRAEYAPEMSGATPGHRKKRRPKP